VADLKDETFGDLVLRSMSDEQLLQHLDKVSEEVKRRNSLLPKTAGTAMVDILKAIGDVARSGRHG
jgi:hypothetical protein